MNRLFLVGVLSVFASAPSRADIFKFFLTGYPKDAGSCHSQSAQLGAHFEEQLKVKVVHVECLKQKKTGSDFVIEYEAPQKLEFTSTSYDLLGTHQPGRYREHSDCLKNLPTQVEIFENATSLTALYAYCRSQELEVGKNWEIVMIASGKVAKQPRLGGYLMFMQPLEVAQQSIVDGLKTGIEKRGGVFADLIFHFNSVMGIGEGSIHYYAPQTIEFNLERLSQVPSLEICLNQARNVSAFLKSESDSLFTVYCGGPSFGYYELHLGTLDKPSFTWQPSADTFNSYSDCEVHHESVLSHYAGSPATPLLGGYCSRNYQTEKYQVMIFKKRAK